MSSAILREAPRPLPSSVPASLGAIILRCLEKSPIDRYQQANEVHSALETVQLSQPASPPQLAAKTIRLTSWLFLFASLLFIALSLGLNWKGSRDWLFHGGKKPAPSVSVPAAKSRKSIAVLSFQNASRHDEEKWLSTALAGMIATELSAGEKLRIIPAENIARMQRDLSLADTDTLASDTLKRVHNYVGSDLILAGSYTTLGKVSGGQLRLDVRLQDAATGETIASVAEAGSEINLFDLVSRVGSDLRNRLGVRAMAPMDTAAVQASYPTSPEVARFYAEGLSKLLVFDSLDALPLLQKAVAADSNFPLAHIALARAWLALGYDARAKDEAKLAFELSGNLSREDRLLVEGQYREMTRDRQVAIDIYRTLTGFFPDDAEFGLKLANAQTRGGKAKDALVTISALKTLPPPQSDDPRISLSEAWAMSALGDSKGQLRAAEKASNQASVLSSRFVEASAKLSEGGAYLNLGEKQQGLAAWEESRRIWASAGYPGEVAKTMINTGIVFYQMGNMPEAKRRYEEALSIWRTTGNKAGEKTALANLADLKDDAGDLAGARQMQQDSLAISREIGDTGDVALTLVDLGDVQISLGDPSGAIANDREAIKLARQLGDDWTLAAALAHISRALYLSGDLPSAKQSVQQALDMTRQANDKPHEARSLAIWGEILMAEGDFPQSRKNLEQALQIRNEIEENSNAAASRLQLASLSIEEGNTSDAEHVAREVRDEYRKEGHPDDEVAADVVLLQALFAGKKSPEAQKELGNTKLLSSKSQNVPNRLALGIIDARIQAAAGKPGDAHQSLAITMLEAVKSGFVPSQFEVRLVQGDIDLNSGKSGSGRADLVTLKKDAVEKGFGLIAQKATALTAKKQPGP